MAKAKRKRKRTQKAKGPFDQPEMEPISERDKKTGWELKPLKL